MAAGKLLDFAQFCDAADLDPFDHEDVPGMIEAGAVRSHEFARLERIPSHYSRFAPLAR